MSATSERVRELISQEAADWFIANRRGLAARQHAGFSAWLRASPVHVEEYLAVAVIANDLPAACADPRVDLDALIARGREEHGSLPHPRWQGALSAARGVAWERFRNIAVALTVAGVLVGGPATWWHSRREAPAAVVASAVRQHFITRHGELQTQHLPDGSVLHLNTDSDVTVEYGEYGRHVALASGEVDFEVAHDPARAFRVFAGAAEVVAVGTHFDVRLKPDSTVVTVAEGRVDVGPARLTSAATDAGATSAGVFVQVGADQQIRYSQEAWPAAPESVNVARTTAWLHRHITFENEPLGRVASEFNRYSPKTIEIASPSLRNLAITGAFTTDDTEAFVAFLRSLDGVRVEVTATRIRVSQATGTPVH